MRKSLLFSMLLMVGAFIVGCSSDGPLTLQDDQGTDIQFENMDQPALVFFFTGVEWDYCKSQLVELQNSKALFSEFPGDIYAVSVSTERDHKNLKKQLNLDYPLVSDDKLELIRKVELVDPNAPKSLRGFAVLDKDGNVLHSQELDPFGNEAADIFSYAAELLTNE
jgi:peroxiredoxin